MENKENVSANRAQLNLMYDAVFKVVFGKHEAFAKALVEVFLGIKVEQLQYLEKDTLSLDPRIKQMVGDIIIKLNDGILIDLEMQKQELSSNRIRSHIYANTLLISQFDRGKAYDENRVYQLFFANYQLQKQVENKHSIFCDRDVNGAIYTDIVQIHFIELVGCKKLMKKDIKALSRKDRWRIYLKYSHDPKYQKQIAEILKQEEELQMVEKTLTQAAQDGSFMSYISPYIEAYCLAIDLRAVAEEKRKHQKKIQNQKRRIKEQQRIYEDQQAKLQERQLKYEDEKQRKEIAERIISLMEQGKSRAEAERLLFQTEEE